MVSKRDIGVTAEHVLRKLVCVYWYAWENGIHQKLIFMQSEVQGVRKCAPAEHGNMEKYADYEGNALVTVDVDCWVRTYTFRAC